MKDVTFDALVLVGTNQHLWRIETILYDTYDDRGKGLRAREIRSTEDYNLFTSILSNSYSAILGIMCLNLAPSNARKAPLLRSLPLKAALPSFL